MKWFADNGSGIAKAIESAKTHGAIFVVYCEGNGEFQRFSRVLNQ